MAVLAAAAPYIGLASAATQAYSGIQQGKAAKANAESVAIQKERAGKAAQAEAQQQAIQERKKANYAESRALAVAASSGAGVKTPTVQNILGDLHEQGDYNVLSTLFSGDSEAEAYNLSATATRNEGRAAKRASYLNAGSTILQGVSSFYSRYNSNASSADSIANYSPAKSTAGDYYKSNSTMGYA